MKKLAKFILSLLIAYPLIGIAVASCAGESDCSVAGRPRLHGNFYRITNIDGERKIVNDTLDSLTITAFYTDSIILNNEKDVPNISLPLQYTNDSTILVFHYSRDTRDTIIIRHSNNPVFVSMECGYEMKQAIQGLAHSRHRMDSIRVTNLSTNTDGTKNLEIFNRYN